jgi:hypothetical protein
MLVELAPSFNASVSRSHMVGKRPDLGLRVQSVDGRYSGLTTGQREDILVLLRKGDIPPRRRCTLAHELGHQLLWAVDRDRLPLTGPEEEDLCELFAQHALMPTLAVRTYLGECGVPEGPDALFTMCRRFQVSIRLAVRGLSEHLSLGCPIAVIIASRRAHPKRPNEIAYRIDGSAVDPRMFAPRDRRLRSSGLHTLNEWIEDARRGEDAAGWERRVALRSGQRGVASWVGPARWSAMALNPPREHEDGGVVALAFIDVSQLQASRHDPTRVRRPSRARRRTDLEHPQLPGLVD